MIQQRTAFVPRRACRHHRSEVVVGWIKHRCCKKRRVKFHRHDDGMQQNTKKPEWSLQNGAIVLLLQLLSGRRSYELTYLYVLKHVLCPSHWSISLRAPSGSIRTSQTVMKAYSHTASAPPKWFQKEKCEFQRPTTKSNTHSWGEWCFEKELFEFSKEK